MRLVGRFKMAAALLLAMVGGAAAEEAGHGMMGHDHGAMPGMTGDMGAMHGSMEQGLSDTSAFGEPGDPAKATRTIDVTASEIMFDKTEIAVKTGETVRFRIKNDGEQPHEFTIGDDAYQQNASAMMTHMSEMGIDLASADHMAMHGDSSNTVMVPVGETKDVVWHFTKAGTFAFACNIPGHAEVGMKGTIEVQ